MIHYTLSPFSLSWTLSLFLFTLTTKRSFCLNLHHQFTLPDTTKMRQNKTVARILLVFSIANLVLAAPAGVRQRGLVTNGPDDDSADGSMHQFFMPESSGSGSSQLNDPLPTPGSTPLQDELPAGSGAPPLHGDSLPASEAAQLHNNPPQASEAAQLHDDPPSGPGAAPFPKDSPSGSGAQPLYEGLHPSWHSWTPVTEIEELPSSPLKSKAPSIEWPPISPPFRWPEEALRASKGSGGSSSGWTEALAAAAEAEAKEAIEAKDHVKPPKGKLPKGFCGLVSRCLMPYRRSFEWSLERELGHRFFWDVRFCSLPSLPCGHLNQPNLTFGLLQ